MLMFFYLNTSWVLGCWEPIHSPTIVLSPSLIKNLVVHVFLSILLSLHNNVWVQYEVLMFSLLLTWYECLRTWLFSLFIGQSWAMNLKPPLQPTFNTCPSWWISLTFVDKRNEGQSNLVTLAFFNAFFADQASTCWIGVFISLFKLLKPMWTSPSFPC